MEVKSLRASLREMMVKMSTLAIATLSSTY